MDRKGQPADGSVRESGTGEQGEGIRTESRRWDCGSWTVAETPRKVVAYERDRGADAAPVAYVRVWNPEKRAWTKRSLKMTVRDERGAIDPGLLSRAIQKAGNIARSLQNGTKPGAIPSVPASAPQQLTLEEGFNLAFRPFDPDSSHGGKYRDTRHRKDARRAADDVMRILGPRKPWVTLTKKDYERVWQRVADVWNGDVVWQSRHTDRHGNPQHRQPGWQSCRIMLATLGAVGRWLEDEGRLAPKTVTAPSNWRGRLKEEWTKMTGESTRKSKPRYTRSELGLLLKALPKADPRVRLALLLGAEYRIGQVLRTRRSNLDLSPVGAFTQGRAEIVGRGRKKGQVVDLTPEQRAAVDAALDVETGYLGKLEAAREAGERQDYPLFPQYAFVDGRDQAPVGAPDRPMNRRYFLRLFHQLEGEAGVEHQKGRGWYGIRRLVTDLAPEYTSDARVLNAMGGWTDTKTREEYQREENPDDTARAAQVRRALRQDAVTMLETGLEETPGEVLEHLVISASAHTLGALIRSLAAVEPARALDVLRVIEAGGLKTMDSEEAWARLKPDDLLPLLEGDATVRGQVLRYMKHLHRD